MLFKLYNCRALTQPNGVLCYFKGRFISRHVIYYNKDGKNGRVVNRDDSSVTKSRTIDAHIAKPTTPSGLTHNLEYLQNLSKKNYFLARLVKVPIDVIVWTQLPKQKKIDSTLRITVSWALLVVFFFVLQICFLAYYYKEHEITQRGFFNIHSKRLIEKFDEIILNEIMAKYEGKFIPSSSPVIQNLDQIMAKLIESNKEFVEDENFDLQWTCIVVDDDQKTDLLVNDEMKFVIVTKAALQLCQNDDQRAYLLANALAHFLLKHKREPLSYIKISNIFTGMKIYFCSRFWMIFSGSNYFSDKEYLQTFDKLDHFIGDFFYKGYRKVADTLNYSDILEEEADRIALQLLARSCYDVREVPKLTTTCRQLIAFGDKEKTPEVIEKYRYIYRHAYNEHKSSFLQVNIPKFVEFRQKCGCLPLK